MSEQAAELDRAIDGLYVAFARHKRPAQTDYSSHAGITEAEAARLTGRALKDLSSSDLSRYAQSALVTWGDASEFKFYLPRLFELVVREPGWVDALLFEKLALAEWAHWTPAERAAVDAFIRALWDWALFVGPDTIDAGDLLRGFGLAGCPLEPFLDRWRTDVSLNATRQIAHLVFLERRDLVGGGKLATYWLPDDAERVLAFLREPATAERVEAAALTHPPGAAGRELAAAADVLTALT